MMVSQVNTANSITLFNPGVSPTKILNSRLKKNDINGVEGTIIMFRNQKFRQLHTTHNVNSTLYIYMPKNFAEEWSSLMHAEPCEVSLCLLNQTGQLFASRLLQRVYILKQINCGRVVNNDINFI